MRFDFKSVSIFIFLQNHCEFTLFQQYILKKEEEILFNWKKVKFHPFGKKWHNIGILLEKLIIFNLVKLI